MDVTKPVLCVSSLKDLTLSELVQWLKVYRDQVILWQERCPSGRPPVADLLEELSYDLLMTMATLEELTDEMVSVVLVNHRTYWEDVLGKATMPQAKQEVPTRRTCGPDGAPTPASDK